VKVTIGSEISYQEEAISRRPVLTTIWRVLVLRMEETTSSLEVIVNAGREVHLKYSA
jgi:hypothetical protein